METILFHEEANSKSKSLKKSRLGENGVVAHARPPQPTARVAGQSWWPGPITACPCPLLSPSSQKRPLTESSPGCFGHGGRSVCLGQPWCPSAPCLYQRVTATKYQRLFFLSKRPACCFFVQTWVHLCLPKRWTCGNICVTSTKTFVCLLLTGSGNCQEIIAKTLCCFSLFAPIISEQPHRCKSDLSSQSYRE